MAISDLNLTNQAKSLLVGTINNVDDPVTFSITPGDGNLKFPTTAGGKYYKIFVVKADKTYEIMKVTSRTADSITAVRAQEGTSKLAFTAGCVVAVRLSAQDILDIIAAQANYALLSGATFTGTVVNKYGADVASAAALPINVAGNLFNVTGTTSVTSMAAKGVGTLVTLHFAGALTLTHHATDLILPKSVNILTSAGYIATFEEYAAGKWRLVSQNREQTLPPPERCMVIAYLTADKNMPGDGSPYEVNAAWTVVKDVGGNFAAGTGRFTAPATGDYQFDFSPCLGAKTARKTPRFTSYIADPAFTAGAISFVGSSAANIDETFDTTITSTGGGLVHLTAGDVRCLFVQHDTGSTRFCEGGFQDSTKLTIYQVA